LGAAVRQAFERRALRLAEDDEFLFFGHLGSFSGLRASRRIAGPHPAALSQQAGKFRCPSPEGEGF
jgi:hypothetical protein